MIRPYLYAAIAAAALALIGGVYLKGQHDAREAREAQDMRDALETHERIDDADTGSGDADADRDWLRNRAGR